MRTEYSEVSGAVKYDDGKVPACRGLTDYFPRALCAVADVSAYGFEKYKGWNGWRHVPDRIKRYLDGMMRHHLDEAKGQLRDPESKRLHAAHRAWNALAVLEAMLEDAEVHASDQSTIMQGKDQSAATGDRRVALVPRRLSGRMTPARRYQDGTKAIDRLGKRDRRTMDRRAPGPLDRRKVDGTRPYRKSPSFGFYHDRTGELDRRKR